MVKLCFLGCVARDVLQRPRFQEDPLDHGLCLFDTAFQLSDDMFQLAHVEAGLETDVHSHENFIGTQLHGQDIPYLLDRRIPLQNSSYESNTPAICSFAYKQCAALSTQEERNRR